MRWPRAFLKGGQTVEQQKKLMYRIATVVIVAVMLTLAAFFLFRGIDAAKKEEAAAREQANYEAILQELKEEFAERSKDLGRPLTDEEKLEIARDRYGLVDENEILLIPYE